MKIIYREATKAYVVNDGMLCLPHPQDESVPEDIRESYRERWEEADAYAKAHPEDVTVEYPPADPTEEELKEAKAKEVRAQRDALLEETDYLLMPDYPISAEDLEAVKAYRQALRDVPEQEGFPYTVVWPEKPSVVS